MKRRRNERKELIERHRGSQLNISTSAVQCIQRGRKMG